MNDAERLRHDPAMRWIVGGKATSGNAASASQIGRFETRWLTTEKNLSALASLSGQWIDRVHARRPPRGVVLDMDSSVSPTYGEQELSVWNGHYECTCYHPACSCSTSSAIWSAARYVPATCTAPMDGSGRAEAGLERAIAARSRASISALMRASPPILTSMSFSETERIKYAIRLPANRGPAREDWPLCSRARSGVRRTRCAASMRQLHLSGRKLDESAPWSSPRSNGSIRASCESARRLYRNQHG